MPWDFETEPDYQAQLDWADRFVREEVEPLDLLWDGLQFTPPDDNLRRVLDPLRKEVRAHGLWATHLRPELGGEGHGQVKLCLLNEILGRSSWAPIVFGCQAPDTSRSSWKRLTAPHLYWVSRVLLATSPPAVESSFSPDEKQPSVQEN